MSGFVSMWSSDKLVDSRLLNRLGAQLVRTVTARVIHRARPARIASIVRDKVEALERDGIVIWPDFLSPEAFDCLRREHNGLFANDHPALQRKGSGPNVFVSAPVSDFGVRFAPEAHRCLADSRLRALLEGAERRRFDHLVTYANIERLTQGEADGIVDPQTRLHCDTFFNTHKVWLYLTDVQMEDGPFVYVRGSHRLTAARLGYIYRASCAPRPQGSRGVTAEEVAKLGQPETVVTCRANTCVIANTCGYHRRLCGVPGRRRDALHLTVRTNPFLVPFRRIPSDS